MREVTSRLQKVLLIVLAMATLVSAVTMVIVRSRKGVLFHDALLKEQITEKARTYTGVAYGEKVSVTVTEEDGIVFVDVTIGDEIRDRFAVEYPLESIRTEDGEEIPGLRITRDGAEYFRGGYDKAFHSETIGYMLYDENGQWYFGDFEDIVTVHVSGDSYWEGYTMDVQRVLDFANGPRLEARGLWGVWFSALLMAVLAAVHTALPDTLFQWNNRWYVKDPEPTEFYYAMHRFGGCVLTIGAIILYIMAITSFP